MKPLRDPTAAARDAALKALAVRDLTRAELAEDLSRRHEPGAIDAAVLELETLGVVDDRRTARQYVESRVAKERPSRSALERRPSRNLREPSPRRSRVHRATACAFEYSVSPARDVVNDRATVASRRRVHPPRASSLTGRDT